MRIPHVIIAGALMAAFVIGCSKSSPTPDITFEGYSGTRQAMFKATNTSQSLIVCEVQFEPSDTGFPTIISIPARGNLTFDLVAIQGRPSGLSVKVMRLVPVHQLTVPMPNTALEPTPTAP